MLRVTIEILPGGREDAARTLSVAHIWRKGFSKKGANYGVRLGSEAPGIDHKTQAYEGTNRTAEVRDYPRWSASIWDLVARSLQRTLRTNARAQSMGPLPRAISESVAVRKSAGISYVRFQDMPDFVRPHFQAFMAHQTVPVIAEEEDPYGCAYVWDWERFLGI